MDSKMASDKEAGEMVTDALPQLSSPSSAGDAHQVAEIDPIAERRLVRKLDLIIFPTFFVIYMMSFLDRINISNAKIQGLIEDLDLYDNRFNIALFVSISPTVTHPQVAYS